MCVQVVVVVYPVQQAMVCVQVVVYPSTTGDDVCTGCSVSSTTGDGVYRL